MDTQRHYKGSKNNEQKPIQNTPPTANTNLAERVSCVYKLRNRQQPAGTMRSHAGAWERVKALKRFWKTSKLSVRLWS